MITARQATPGTKVVVSGTWLGTPTSGNSVETVHSTFTVGRWQANGDGTATLFATTGQCLGRYTSDHKFAETLAESW